MEDYGWVGFNSISSSDSTPNGCAPFTAGAGCQSSGCSGDGRACGNAICKATTGTGFTQPYYDWGCASSSCGSHTYGTGSTWPSFTG